MNKCKRCGKSFGLLSGVFSDYCDSCKTIIAEEKKSEQERIIRERYEEEQQRREIYTAYKTKLVKKIVQSIKKRLANREQFFSMKVFISRLIQLYLMIM